MGAVFAVWQSKDEMMTALITYFLIIQAFMLALFALQVWQRRSQRERWPQDPSDGWPTVEVVLCLRGADPSLKSMLSALAEQCYQGRWRLQIVVDSFSDASWRILESWSAAPLDVCVHMLERKPAFGSLKCAAILQACQYLDKDAAVVAFVDADAVVRSSWLADLVKACLQPGVGAVSGNRWYLPENGSFCGWIRAVWNAGVVVPMGLWNIPWGGSLALRRQVIESPLWRRLLKNGLCEDTGLLTVLRSLGLRYQFRPELVVVDCHDDISLVDLFRWIKRQLLTVRLHHPAWPLALVYGLLTLFLPLVSLLVGEWRVFVAYEMCLLLLLLCVQSLISERPFYFHFGWIVGLIPAQLLNGVGAIVACLASRVEWRGAHYAVDASTGVVRLLPLQDESR